jgi:hypothetical protein
MTGAQHARKEVKSTGDEGVRQWAKERAENRRQERLRNQKMMKNQKRRRRRRRMASMHRNHPRWDNWRVAEKRKGRK